MHERDARASRGKAEFDSYVSTYIETTLDKFGLPNKNKYYGGSSITSNTSFSGGVQDTDWTVYWDRKEDIIEFINKQKDLYRQKAIIENINKPGKYANARANSMLSFFEKNGYIPKNSIISIDKNGIVYRLQDYLDDFPEFLKTDITPKLKGYNNTSPSILY